MTHSASAGFEQNGSAQKRGCNWGSMGRWSPWEIGAVVAGFVVFWPLGLIALFLKWKNGEIWKGSAQQSAPWNGLRADFAGWSSGWKSHSHGFAGSGNAAFDVYKREQLKRLDEERRKLEDEQKAFRDFVERLRRAKDQDEFDRFMAERRASASSDQADSPDR
ncbi:DUF2852 domain-containing protein [Aestuariivirga sp.]|uniref:DUF2852 domain-containing protein n=1 Tax=Aestuariivirga sp. TaxID=2650926 RepID=UPI0025BB2DE5|nr:DUF2852 domain-containing protein [Aestuariivirga sp.]MCA3554057.1 DUF2852 domain-containing protein [Aestuariivirga sp.]